MADHVLMRKEGIEGVWPVSRDAFDLVYGPQGWTIVGEDDTPPPPPPPTGPRRRGSAPVEPDLSDPPSGE